MARKRTAAVNPARKYTVVFDYGGVIAANFDPVSVIHPEVGGDVDEVRSVYWSARRAYDAGASTQAEYWGAVLAAAGIEDPTEDEILDLQDVDDRYWGTIARGSRELIHDLARNEVRMVLLSNTSAAFGEYIRKQDWFEAFDFAIISGEEKTTKPDRAIFDITLDAIAHETGGVARPGNVIFFDDLEDNVAAARALGIDAHLWPRNGSPIADATDPYGSGGQGLASADATSPTGDPASARPGWEIAREILQDRGVPLD